MNTKQRGYACNLASRIREFIEKGDHENALKDIEELRKIIEAEPWD